MEETRVETNKYSNGNIANNARHNTGILLAIHQNCAQIMIKYLCSEIKCSLSCFQLSVVKPKPKQLLFSLHT